MFKKSKNVYKKSNKTMLLIIGGILIVSFAIPFLVKIIIFGNKIIPEWSSFLGSYIGGIVGGIATLTAVVISLNISKTIQKDSEFRENILIVYYDLYIGLNDLKKLYINCKNPKFKDIPLRMFFSNEWIKNVVKISNNINDIDKIYKLYGYLEMVKDEIKSKSELQILKGSVDDFDDEAYKNNIENISKKIFSDDLINCLDDIKKMSKYQNSEEVELHVAYDLNDDYGDIISNIKLVKDRLMNPRSGMPKELRKNSLYYNS